MSRMAPLKVIAYVITPTTIAADGTRDPRAAPMCVELVLVQAATGLTNEIT